VSSYPLNPCQSYPILLQFPAPELLANRTAGPDDADTTRKPRGQEKDGVEYHFTTREQFEKMISEGGFIEHAKFGDNYYGTSYQAIKDIEDAGRRPLLDIEMEVTYPLPPPLSPVPTSPSPSFPLRAL